nr:PREDICTED: KH domain-containing protein akap-1 [Bemisia tabaci]XP_018914275.1 PREDICTED: KH domain-containing protein akap-1 [Bemisia tabaci]XP_018914276.1 PREDICTED: KH domain-containing protein akap-1 [Bemisia tabaci]XP_018914277.1 PREDICTED: KH domain-containing protein akap-1 [Bemisia tabaci]
MAPVQSRQLLMWSFPTAVVLFSYLYYKRKKAFLSSDTGGKSIASSQANADNECLVDSTSLKETLESSIHNDSFDSSVISPLKEAEDVKAVIQKVIRDLETIAPIPENSPIEEIVEEVLQITDTSNIELEEEAQCEVSSSDNSSQVISCKNSSSKLKNSSDSKLCDQSLNKTPFNGEWGASDDEIIPDSTTKNNGELITSNSCKKCKDDSDYVKLGDTSGKSGKKKKKKKNQVVDISMFFSDNERRHRYRSDSMNWRKRDSREPRRNNYRGKNDYECDTQEKLLHRKLEKLTMDERTPSKFNQTSLRDSANHSPAEAMMLASPTLSHCSDNHSEGGSSDSGKGCSETATPAGGSSLAGDHQPIVYEFIVPQVITGRLIGLKGHNLHELKAKSNTNIYVRMHPESMDLRICAIEGVPSDVDCALALIRKKFPLSQNPGLTLERISPNDFNLQIKPDYFQLHLVENMNNDVVVSSLISAGYMFLQQPTHPTYQQLSRLNFTMNANYCSPDAPVMTEPQLNAVVAAPAMGGWYRAQIVEIIENNQCQVRFLDYGGYSTLDCSMLRKIRADFLCLPFQAIECALANVVPAGGSEIWSEEARLFVYEMTVGRVLQAQIYDYAVETGIPLVYLYSTFDDQVILINEELVKRGFAELPPAIVPQECLEVVNEIVPETDGEIQLEESVENEDAEKADSGIANESGEVAQPEEDSVPETESLKTDDITCDETQTTLKADETSSTEEETVKEE